MNNPHIAHILPEDSELERLATGFQFTEGPVWNASGGFLLFSDIRANRIYKWSPTNGVTIFREPSGNSNGLTYDKEMRLIICEHSNRRLTRMEKDDASTVLIERFRNKRLNSPNDVVVKSNGMIYFTDPPYCITPEEQELSFQGVYFIDPKNKKVILLKDDFDRPNGISFSPDETVLYIADSSIKRRHIRAFDVKSDGTIRNNRVFSEIRSDLPGNPDGMKVDIEGNLYVAAAGGLWVFSKNGDHLGTIRTPEQPANCAWGDTDWKSLFITARTSVYRIKLGVSGIKTS
ncbi:MAG: SMP-30/gluconolactonase/LRE family protein [Candidatus Bathyarchaeota archaeon]|nr:MAG: SMP-30/gluconolactonase/LRE family protein [Candidatus Bathyarchaeota archaeon]